MGPMDPRAMFDRSEVSFTGPGLELRCHLAPWDRPIFGANTAAISAITLRDASTAAAVFAEFAAWCDAQNVCLVSARLPQTQLAECGFLEACGFRFIELNHTPVKTGLAEYTAAPDIAVMPAEPSDVDEIVDIAGRIFETGRLQLDPMIDSAIGHRRYAVWAENAFQAPHQSVIKCVRHGRIVAFMVVEQPAPHRRFWSLVGVAPGLAGQGLGGQVWRSVLAQHHREGVMEVSTSISSHNVAVHNLYVSLGFRFPPPSITLHWCPRGPVMAGQGVEGRALA